MGQLKDTVVSGNLRVTDDILANKINGVTVGSSPKFTDTTYSDATQSTHGLMSTSDKTKLDGVRSCPSGVHDGNGVGAVTIGEGDAVANGDRCLAIGSAIARGDDSLAVGNVRVIAGGQSIAFGNAEVYEDGKIEAYLQGFAGGCAWSDGKIMTQMPLDEHTDGVGGMAFGFANGATINAEGNGARAQGFSQGASQIYAAEDGSIAEGYAYDESSIVASGLGAHAEGCASSDNANIRATNRGAHAEGSADEFCTILASGIGAHAEGVADIGGNITASGKGSHAEGYGTTAQNNYEHAQGTFNKSNLTSTGTAAQQAAGSTRFSVGIGANNVAPANAIEVMVNGDTYIKGVGGYDGTNATTSGIQPIAKGFVQTTNANGLKIVVVNSESQVGTDADTIYIVRT